MDPQGPAARAISREPRILFGEPVTLVTAALDAIIESVLAASAPASSAPPAREIMPRLQSEGHVPGRFPTTQWSRVVTAASRDAPEAREALSGLCQAYWYPIYAYIRHRGHTPEQAQDLTQDFFAYVLEHDLIAMADPHAGPLPCVPPHRLRPPPERAPRSPERGEAGRRPVPALHRPASTPSADTRCEPAHELTPERIFDRTWALTLLCRVVERLRREYDDAGRSDRFEELLAILTRDPASDSQAEIARRLGTTEGNVRVAVHRLRRRYGLLLREEIAATVGDEAQIDDEIRALFSALRQG